MKIVNISDSHSFHRKISIPDGDVLICAGDISFKGELKIIKDFANWFEILPHKYKICIFGNHEIGIQDFQSEKRSEALLYLKNKGIIYLENSSVTIQNYKIYGSPVTPFFHNWAWNVNRGPEIAKVWKNIPDDTNILITHGPPYNILDLVENDSYNKNRDLHQGCQDLLNRIQELKNLKLHVFGHLHYQGGQQLIENNKIFVNAAICNDNLDPVHKPVVVEI